MTRVGFRTRRFETFQTFQGVDQFWAGGTQYNAYPYSIKLYNFGLQDDGTHPVEYLGKPEGRAMDIGGALFSATAKMDFPSGGTVIGNGPKNSPGLTWIYEGDIIAQPFAVPTAVMPDSWWSTSHFLDSFDTRMALGATAIARCKPASPQASFGQFMAEIYRDGVPRLLSNFKVRDEVDKFRSLGSNYLNVEFGWKPFVSDLKKTARALDSQSSILEDLRKNSGRAMRRRYAFPSEPSTQVLIQDDTRPWPNPNVYQLSQTGGRTVTSTVTKKTWFSGEFIYRFPAADAGLPARAKGYARQILGIDLTPETLWNIAPWTWLSDWVANVGDVMANISAISEDDLVMRYGYLMQEAKQVYTTTHRGLSTPYGSITPTLEGRAVYTTKTRVGASPFGFGLTNSDFSARQFAVLGALGMTRGPRHSARTQ